MTSAKCWAVVVAGGRGVRLGLDKNKVLVELAGRSILSRCLDAVCACSLIDGIVLVISEEDHEAYEALAKKEGICAKLRAVVNGGSTRQASVYNGLMAVPDDVEIIAVHDAARAFVPERVIRATVESACAYGSGVAATPVTDTIKQVNHEDIAEQTLDRARLRAVQTPQTFARTMLVDAYERALAEGFEATDDASLVERYFGNVHLVVREDGFSNRKLTTREDLKTMEQNLNVHMGARGHGQMRIGHGYDVHALGEDRKLILCGVEIEHDMGLIGHSDADVATHALMDALLGAAAMGDIGRHFPDNDDGYKGISSCVLLNRVMEMIRASGFEVVNCDITVIAQSPKLMPYMKAMRVSVADAMGVDAGCVNVKATTTERLGFEGRREGISAHAVVLLGQG